MSGEKPYITEATRLGQVQFQGFLVLKPSHMWSEEYEKTVRAMEAAYIDLPIALNAFLDYVYEHYAEIDMNESDENAWNAHLPYITGSILFDVDSPDDDRKSKS